MVELVFTYWGFLNSRSKDFDKSRQNAGRATSVVVALKGMYWWRRWWWPVAVKQLRGHQWSMRTCPPWEAVSHFCCFILLLPLQDTENKETFVLQFAFFDGDAPSPHRHPTLQTLRTHRPEPVIGPASSACYTSARGDKWTICWMSSWHSMPGLIASYISISFICHRGSLRARTHI